MDSSTTNSDSLSSSCDSSSGVSVVNKGPFERTFGPIASPPLSMMLCRLFFRQRLREAAPRGMTKAGTFPL